MPLAKRETPAGDAGVSRRGRRMWGGTRSSPEHDIGWIVLPFHTPDGRSHCDHDAVTGSMRLRSSFLTLPTRVLTGQQII
jgi:hypothetical protein